MANTNTEIIAMLETNPSQAIRGVLDTLYLYNPATVNDLIAQLNDVINKVGFEAIVVDALPETGKKGTIYFVPSGGETPNVYNEYVWVTETEKFEMVGSAQVDLSNYYTKEEVDNALKGLDPLPDQTDNAGKFLTTDGTTASWGNALANNAPAEANGTTVSVLGTLRWVGEYFYASNTVCIGYDTYSASNCVVIGAKAASGDYSDSVAIGYKASAYGRESTAIGANTSAGDWGVAIGSQNGYNNKTQATGNSSIAIGNARATASGAVQIGYGTNSTSDTFQFRSYCLVGADGTIPTDRYTTTPTTAGTYVPKLKIAEDGTATREWGTESGGGGGASLPIVVEPSTTYWPNVTKVISGNDGKTFFGVGPGSTLYIGNTYGGKIELTSTVVSCYFTDAGELGSGANFWKTVHVKKLSAKSGQYLTVPTEGGTLARLEDLNDITTVTIKVYD